MPTVHRVTFKGTHSGGQDVVTGLHLRVEESNVWADVPAEDILDAVDTEMTPAWRACATPSTTLDEITITTVDDPADPSDLGQGDSKAIGLAGLRASGGNDLPKEICGIVSYRTDFLGRALRGHGFLPPTLNSDQVAGEQFITGAGGYFAGLQLWAAAVEDGAGGTFWAGIAGFTITFGVYSRRRRALDLDPWFAPITAAIPRRAVHYLRSRDRGS